MLVNSCREDLEGGMRLKRVWKVVSSVKSTRVIASFVNRLQIPFSVHSVRHQGTGWSAGSWKDLGRKVKVI